MHCYIGPVFVAQNWKVNSVLIQLFAPQQILLNIFLNLIYLLNQFNVSEVKVLCFYLFVVKDTLNGFNQTQLKSKEAQQF